MYNANFTAKDCDNMGAKELQWQYGKLLQQKIDEKKAQEEAFAQTQKDTFTWRQPKS